MLPLHDVAIVGAGPAGFACGMLAARARLRVVVIEKEAGRYRRPYTDIFAAGPHRTRRTVAPLQCPSNVVTPIKDFMLNELTEIDEVPGRRLRPVV